MTSAPTLTELAAELGIDGEQLERRAAFNEHARRARTRHRPRHGPFRPAVPATRANEPNPMLGAIAEAPFSGMRLKFVGTGIGSSGVHADGDGHVARHDGGGSAVCSRSALAPRSTTTRSGYNSGFALGRGLTLAYLVANDLTRSTVR